MISTHRLQKFPDSSSHSLKACWEISRSSTDTLRIVKKVDQAMAAQNYSDDDIFDLHLALTEAITNAVKHGHGGDFSQPVQVRYHVNSDRVLAEVEDQGPGFDPDLICNSLAAEHLDQPGGRGLLLMRTYATWIKYNERGNCVLLCKHRSLD